MGTLRTREYRGRGKNKDGCWRIIRVGCLLRCKMQVTWGRYCLLTGDYATRSGCDHCKPVLGAWLMSVITGIIWGLTAGRSIR